MAPTTLLGQVTSTTPYGRDAKLNGFPMKITELLAQLDGTCYVTRQSAETPAAVRKTKNALKKAFQNTRLQKGLSFVEVVGTCNSGWKMTPVDANKSVSYTHLDVYKRQPYKRAVRFLSVFP